MLVKVHLYDFLMTSQMNAFSTCINFSLNISSLLFSFINAYACQVFLMEVVS